MSPPYYKLHSLEYQPASKFILMHLAEERYQRELLSTKTDGMDSVIDEQLYICKALSCSS